MAVDLKKYDFPQVLRSVFEVEDNCLRVKTINSSGGGGGQLEVLITHTEDSIRLGDGTNYITSTNVSGKNGLDVNLINTSLSTDEAGTIVNNYAEVTNIASGVLTTLTTYTASANTRLKSASASCDNKAIFTVLIDGVVQSKKRTYYASNFNAEFNFEKGIELTAGQVVTVKAIHSSSSLGDFNSNIVIVQE